MDGLPTISVPVPDVLGAAAEDCERLYAVITKAPPAERYGLDLRAVGFVKPHGAVALVAAARLLAERSGQPVWLDHVEEQVYSYLHRMDLLTVGRAWLHAATIASDSWSRSPWTSNLLELTPITGPQDVEAVIVRADRIFAPCLARQDLAKLLNVVSEVCANVYQHSGDPHGSVLIQRYHLAASGEIVVVLAVGDLGRGVRGSLRARHGPIGRDPLNYLQAALQGYTARPTGRGGLGLRRVEQIARSTGGFLWLRSETAAILSRGNGGVRHYRHLANVPGTQVVVEIRTGDG